ncbi:helix-turn-helix domain-containing protein [Nocardia puris]|uniref:Helix-turn-helix protein n=1 Tax=Nocardia puris TaxID=208602 RepID=A0A366DBW8_9NOCA|nr:helix-turn-helix transcriptional regulator [Nocardia puris]RBO87523.1 helix-turn-helix protein [Nocardia puris]
MTTTWFTRTPEAAAKDAEDQLLFDATDLIAGAMTTAGLTRHDLAALLSTHPTELARRLNGRRNLTLRDLARTAHTLGYRVDLNFVSVGDPALPPSAENGEHASRG